MHIDSTSGRPSLNSKWRTPYNGQRLSSKLRYIKEKFPTVMLSILRKAPLNTQDMRETADNRLLYTIGNSLGCRNLAYCKPAYNRASLCIFFRALGLNLTRRPDWLVRVLQRPRRGLLQISYLLQKFWLIMFRKRGKVMRLCLICRGMKCAWMRICVP